MRMRIIKKDGFHIIKLVEYSAPLCLLFLYSLEDRRVEKNLIIVDRIWSGFIQKYLL